MEVSQAIRSRRSIRRYKAEPIAHEVIEQIVADAAYAPSWKNTQIARYVLVEDRAVIEKMAEEMVLDFKLNEKTLKACPALMVLTYVTGRSGYERDGSFSTPKRTALRCSTRASRRRPSAWPHGSAASARSSPAILTKRRSSSCCTSRKIREWAA